MKQRSISAPNVLSIDQQLYSSLMTSNVVRIQRNSLPDMTNAEEIGYELHSSSVCVCVCRSVYCVCACVCCKILAARNTSHVCVCV